MMWFCLEECISKLKDIILTVIFTSDEKYNLGDCLDFPVKLCISYSKYYEPLTLKVLYTDIMLVNMGESLRKEI